MTAVFPKPETDPTVAGALAAHEADTTQVHGLPDTATVLRTDAVVVAATAATPVLRSRVTGDTQDRLQMLADGTRKIGSGAVAPSVESDYAALAGNPDLLINGAITRDANGAATSAPVKWPNGATGAYTGTPSTSVPGAIDTYTITHVLGATTTTYTQPVVTRDINGAVTTRPAITVA